MSTLGKSFSFSGGAATATNSANTGSSGTLFGAAPSFEKRQRAGSAAEGTAPKSTAFGSGALQQNTTLSSSFGFNTATPTAAPTTGVFGGGGNGIFGSSKPAATTAPAAPSLFGSAQNTGGVFGSTQSQQQQQQLQNTQQQSTSEVDELSKQLLLIKECWDPSSANYQFRHYFYNVVEPEQTQLYQCPPGHDPFLWQQAQRDNPDPNTLVPVLATGFDDLRKRVDSQSIQMQSYQERTVEVANKLSNTLQKHYSETTVRLAECRRRQAGLSQRLLEFMKLLQLLRLRGQLLHPEEEVFRVRVEHLEKEMTCAGSLKQRLAELQDHAYRLQANSRRRRELAGTSSAGYAGDGYEISDESQLGSVMKMLNEKQHGLAHLTQVVSQDKQSIGEVESAIEDHCIKVRKQKEARERAQMSQTVSTLPW